MIVTASLATVIAIGLLGYAMAPRRSAATSPFVPLGGQGQNTTASIKERIIRPLVDTTARYARRITPSGVSQNTSQHLLFAGLGSRIPVELVYVAKFVLATGAAMGALWLGGGLSGVARAVLVAGLTVAGFLLPDALVRRRANRRQERIAADLPNTLDQLTVLLEAGLGFNSAIDRIARSTTGPLIDELARALHSIRLGRSRSDALEDIATRTGTKEVRQFVSAIKQADELGVPIARVVRVQSNHMRELRRLKSEEQAMRLPVKLVFPMVLCMLPALFAVLLGPVMIRIGGAGL